MNRDKLTKFADRIKELETDLKIIERRKENITTMTANYDSEKVSRSGKTITDPEAERLVQLIDQTEKIKKQLEEKKTREYEELIKEINKIDKEIYRVILKEKYILGTDLAEIAENVIHYTYKHTCRLHGYALKEWDKL